jgi:ribosomal protein S18 acetylase RimI-like enzyme
MRDSFANHTPPEPIRCRRNQLFVGQYVTTVIRSATRDDAAAIRALLARANETPYAIEPVAEEKVFGDGFWGPPTVRVFEENALLRGVAVTCGNYLRLLAVDREHRRRGIGSRLLADTTASVFAAEPGNYFTPGVIESDHGTIAFLRARRFRESGSTWNMEASTSSASEDGPVEAGAPSSELLHFVSHHFGPIWAFEAKRAAEAFHVQNAGFAVIEANNRGLGTFGPAGVVESTRGHGYGRRLVRAALAGLGRRGYERAIIPWTDAIDFYRRSCQAEPVHRFLSYRR